MRSYRHQKEANKSSRMLISLLLIIFSVSINGFTLLSANDVERLKEYHVIPDIITNAPPARVDVTYGDNLVVDMGNEFTTMQVHEFPEKIMYPVENGAFYTLILTDPDVPPSIGSTSIQHLIIVNIPGVETEKGDLIWQYIGASPPEGSGFHRYIFHVYKQKGVLKTSDYARLIDEKIGKMSTRLQNTMQDVRQILQLGDPIAVNFFRVQHDENSDKYLEEAFAALS